MDRARDACPVPLRHSQRRDSVDKMIAIAVPASTDVRVPANHVDGWWTPSTGIEHLEDRDPATGKLLARVPLSTATDGGDGSFRTTGLVKDIDNTRFYHAEPDRPLRGFLPGRLREAGLIARANDGGDAVLQIAPPLISDRQVLDEIVAGLRDVLADARVRMGVGATLGVA